MNNVNKQGFERKHGATLTGYGLVVGLIAIVALGAVTGVGSQTNELFTEVSDTLSDVGQTTAGQSEATPEATSVTVDATNCTTLRATGETIDGEYLIDPDGSGGLAPFAVYCDMTRFDGGWALVSAHDVGAASTTANAIGFGSPVSAGMDGKLSDAQINAILNSMGTPIYMGDRSDMTGCDLFANPAAAWDATRSCSGANPAACQWEISRSYSTNLGDYSYQSQSNGSSHNFDVKDNSDNNSAAHFTYVTNNDNNHRVWEPSGCSGYSSNINPADVRFWIKDIQ